VKKRVRGREMKDRRPSTTEGERRGEE